MELARNVRHREQTHATLSHGLSNALVESVNTRIRLLTALAFGFRSPDALIGLAMLKLGGYCPPLPSPRHHDRTADVSQEPLKRQSEPPLHGKSLGMTPLQVDAPGALSVLRPVSVYVNPISADPEPALVLVGPELVRFTRLRVVIVYGSASTSVSENREYCVVPDVVWNQRRVCIGLVVMGAAFNHLGLRKVVADLADGTRPERTPPFLPPSHWPDPRSSERANEVVRRRTHQRGLSIHAHTKGRSSRRWPQSREIRSDEEGSSARSTRWGVDADVGAIARDVATDRRWSSMPSA